MHLSKRLLAEMFGTFWLVLGGCGSAVLAASFAGPVHGLGIGFVGVALAFGLTVLTMAFAIGHISGCHLNPAVSVGLVVAGRFPAHSGPNCFGAVLAAAGVDGADRVWMQREPFEAWLAEHTRPGGPDDGVGTVLVWRSRDGLVQHAAVTLGDGWALHKPSQGWMSPTKVLRVPEVKLSARTPGRLLHRHHLR